MKNLLLLLLVVAGIGLVFHDRQQTADLATTQAELAKAQSDNAALTQQVDSLQMQLRNVIAQSASQPSFSIRPNQPAAPPSQVGFGLQGSGALDRPAYRDH